MAGALKDYDQAIGLDSNQADLYFDRATIYFQKQEFTKALTDYTRAILLNPQNKDFFV
ncbi:MAG: tetratricopeptide repeat protein [Chloroflexia bacterium]|nr:tetratricopeptide repeat protein [Chloroflexia bacterium]